MLNPFEARKEILKTGMPIDSHFQATAHFTWAELLRHQKEIPSLGVLTSLLKVAQLLELYREKLFNSQPVTITSGWRSENYNISIGGASKSTHILGMALDFTVKGFTPEQVYRILDVVHFGGLEFTEGAWNHADLRKQNVRFKPNGTILQPHYDHEKHEKLFGRA